MSLAAVTFRLASSAGAVFCAALLSVMPLAAQPPFEGVVTMRISGSGPAAGTTQDVEYFASRSGKARISMTTPMGSAAMIMAPADRKLYLLLDAQNAYVEQDMDALRSETEEPRIVRTGKKETIAGVECEHITVNETDICAAKGLGSYMNAGSSLMRGRVSAWQKALLAEGYFPLKVTQSDGTVQMVVTKVERKAIDPAMFRVPGNYTKMQMPQRGG